MKAWEFNLKPILNRLAFVHGYARDWVGSQYMHQASLLLLIQCPRGTFSVIEQGHVNRLFNITLAHTATLTQQFATFSIGVCGSYSHHTLTVWSLCLKRGDEAGLDFAQPSPPINIRQWRWIPIFGTRRVAR